MDRGTIVRLATVVAVAGLVLFTNLGGPRLWDRDEPRNAGCAREMLARGDWIVPTFNAELRTHKPVLTYWLMMSAYLAFGEGEFAARFWSAALGVGTCLATCAIGRRLFSPAVGLWAGVILATSLLFGVAGRAATPDSPLIFCSTLALAAFVWFAFPPRATAPKSDLRDLRFPTSLAAAACIYACMALAVLAKGPVGILLPTAVIGLFLLIARLPPQPVPVGWTGRLAALARPFAPRHFLATTWSMQPLVALALLLLIAAPWYVAVGMATDGEFLWGFFGEHNLGRATRAMEGHRGPPLLFYAGAILVGFFPWSTLAAPLGLDLWRRLRRDDPWRPGLIFALCWIGVYVGLFSLAGTKLPSYVTPCYPALALLAGVFVQRWTAGKLLVAPRWLALALAALGLVGLALLIGIPLAARRWLPGEESLALVGLFPLGAALLAGYWNWQQRPSRAATALAIGATALATALLGVVPVRIDRHQRNHELLAAVFAAAPEPQLAAYKHLEPSWVFYSHRPIRELASPQDSPSAAVASVRAHLDQGPQAFVITTRKKLAELTPHLPPDVHVLAETPLFLKEDQLVVLGHSRPASAAARAGEAQRR